MDKADLMISFDPATNGVQLKMNMEKLKSLEFAAALLQIAADSIKRQIDFTHAMQQQQAMQEAMQAQRMVNGLLLGK